MNRRTQVILGCSVVVLGLGVYALGLMEQESTVRFVADLHAEPMEHRAGSYTLMGIPQPERLDALPDAPANPDYEGSTVHVRPWTDGQTHYLSTYELGLERNGTALTWTLTNTTRTTGATDPVTEPTVASWQTSWDGMVFQVDDFETGQTVWALYDGVLRDPIQPKPSQLQGRLAEPDSLGAPDGALIYLVEPDGYTVGCSSKFLPDDLKDEYGDETEA